MSARIFRFGLFELNTGTRQLHKQGRRVHLQDQPLRVLEILLAEPGKLVTRPELRQHLWPSDVYVDFDLGLTGAMKKLRLALGDNADNPRFIETIPKSGYRFIAPVEIIIAEELQFARPAEVTQASGAAAQMAREVPVVPARPLARAGTVTVVILAVCALAAALFWLRPEEPPLRVTRITKLTATGNAWSRENLLSDGSRLYYTEITPQTGYASRQVLLNGNEDTVLREIPANLLIRALSPDGTTFLAISQLDAARGIASQVYEVPVTGGTARRLGTLHSNDFAWSPRGDTLVFASGNRLLVANADGTTEHEVARFPGDILYPRWSPDGGRISCAVEDARGQLALWEVASAGGSPRRLLANAPASPTEGFGEWSPDGRYFVYTAEQDGTSNLWVIENTTDWRHRGRTQPVQLTAGPLSYYRPLPNRDGSRIFVLGTERRGELVRYDVAERRFVESLGGRSADQLDFTLDGKWVTFVAYPDGTLWRARSDGSDALQLTAPPLRVTNPRWSPDGKQIVFTGRQAGQLPHIYMISPEGGSPESVVADAHAQSSPSWSPDGSTIIFGRDFDAERQDLALYQVDIHSHEIRKIPGTDGLYAPLWSPDGRKVVAQSAKDDRRLVLIDHATGMQTVLVSGQADYPAWSSDSRYIFFNTLMTGHAALFRVRVSDGSKDKIADVPFQTNGIYGTWSGLAPDGSLLVLRDRDRTDVYALSVTEH